MDCEWLPVPEELKQRRGLSWQIRSDNGPEFVSRAVDQWAYEPDLQWHTIQPGRQMENRYVENFNGCFRDECLSENWFRDLADARGEDHAMEGLQRKASAQQLRASTELSWGKRPQTPAPFGTGRPINFQTWPP